MVKEQMIVIGEKETFMVRVLTQKAQSADVECKFVPCTVNDINANMENVTLIALYMEDEMIPNESVLHFITEKLEDKGIQIMIIGDQRDIPKVCEHIPPELVYRTFARPIDNAEYVEEISEYYKKIALGEFKKSILVVDDDPQYLSIVREWLKDTYKVSMANSGLQAIKWLGKNRVDLILLDHEMPITGGPQVLEMLRNDADTSSIPVIFLTGKGDKESVMAVKALHPEGYFLKTIKREELLEKLKEFFLIHR
ncbi:MAG: response regulator [Lachnospiraceae bacterium]|nr:response regulator [Lachnospiraceae bacterium]